jgi:hypothetical protein
LSKEQVTQASRVLHQGIVLRILERPQRIADALKNNLLTEKEKFRFFLAAILVNGIFGTRSFIFEFNFYTLIEFGLTIGGTWWCFQENSQGDNRQFLERFICLQASIAIRIYTIVGLLYYLLGAVWSVLERSVYFPQMTTLSFLLWNGLWIGGTCYIYIRLRKLIRYVSVPVASL